MASTKKPAQDGRLSGFRWPSTERLSDWIQVALTDYGYYRYVTSSR